MLRGARQLRTGSHRYVVVIISIGFIVVFIVAVQVLRSMEEVGIFRWPEVNLAPAQIALKAVNRFTASVELTGSCFCTLAVPGAAAGAEARRERRRVAGLVSVEAAGAAAERANVCFGAEVSVDRAGEDSEVSTAAGVASPPLCCDSSVAGLWARRERLRRLPRDRCSWDESCAGSSVKAAVNESNVSDC